MTTQELIAVITQELNDRDTQIGTLSSRVSSMTDEINGLNTTTGELQQQLDNVGGQLADCRRGAELEELRAQRDALQTENANLLAKLAKVVADAQ